MRRGHTTYTDSTGAKLGIGVFASQGAGDGPAAVALDVSDNLLAVADERRAAGAVVLKGAVAAVVDGHDGADGGKEGEDGKLHFSDLRGGDCL